MTVGRVHGVLGKGFGDVLGFGLGVGQILVVAEVSPDHRRCTLTQRILGLTAVVIQGGDGWKGFEFVVILPSSRC